MKKLKPLLFAFIILFFTNCEKDFDTDEVTTNKNNFNFKTITFNEVAKINKKTSLKVLKLKTDFSQRNTTIQGVLVDTTYKEKMASIPFLLKYNKISILTIFKIWS